MGSERSGGNGVGAQDAAVAPGTGMGTAASFPRPSPSWQPLLCPTQPPRTRGAVGLSAGGPIPIPSGCAAQPPPPPRAAVAVVKAAAGPGAAGERTSQGSSTAAASGGAPPPQIKKHTSPHTASHPSLPHAGAARRGVPPGWLRAAARSALHLHWGNAGAAVGNPDRVPPLLRGRPPPLQVGGTGRAVSPGLVAPRGAAAVRYGAGLL